MPSKFEVLFLYLDEEVEVVIVTVWPDVGIRVAQIFPKVDQKVTNPAVFTKN